MSKPIVKQVAALDNINNVVGVYAVDANNPELPGVEYSNLIDMPDSPVGTGEFITVPVDPEFPDGDTVQVEILERPAIGWSYSNNVWTKN